jgi:elongator complex protein 3
MSKKSQAANAIIKSSIGGGVQTKDGFLALKRRVAGKMKVKLPATAELRRAYGRLVAAHPEQRDERLDKILTRREVRSLSGVAVITVLTKPYPCPGQCTYCPSEARMPKSYLSNEPAAMRALALQFEPWRQVTFRLRALIANGHSADKIELIVKGGTWSAYPWKYQQWFIKRCFDACNQFGGQRQRTGGLTAAQLINETTRHRIIGLTLETRPDRITPAETAQLRQLGCTRIELGVQTLDEKVLLRVRRGHDTAAVARAVELLKDAGFKTDFHLMPQLPGATPRSDLASMKRIFTDPAFRPDMIKIYPCVVLATAELHKEWRRGTYKPYPDKQLLEMLIRFKLIVPRYCRISRLIRDIPSTSIIAGNPVTNLRQVIRALMDKRGLRCACLRCREIGHAAKGQPQLLTAEPKLFDETYASAGGLEHFLSFEDAKRRAVFAFCRLRLPSKKPAGATEQVWRLMPEIRDAAFLRELHTYGHLVPIDMSDPEAAQHKGLGKKLMAEAERLARTAGYGKMAVISGIGVRAYYRKLGYRLQGTYMVKKL